MSHSVNLWPVQASAHAGEVDLLIGSFGALVIALSAPVFLLLTIFAVRYRHGRRADRTHKVDRNIWLEVSWSIIPFLLIVGFFVWSTSLFFQLRRPPADSFVINVVGQQWMWKFQHPSGAREINELHVPVGVPVRLVMTSQDVIHSLYIPALRIKQDVLPGRTTSMWFEVTRPGVYPLRCAEYCGAEHSRMIGSFIALSQAEYSKWGETVGASRDLAAQGETLFRRFGCSGCHTPGSSVHAPRLIGLFGSPVPLSDGRVIVADDQYIHDSILLPNKDIAAGYPPIMPTFANILSAEEVMLLGAYIKSLGGAER